MRPTGPVPWTWRRSTPASNARRRTAGEAIGFSPGGRGGPNDAARGGGRGAGAGGGVGRGSGAGSGCRGAGLAGVFGSRPSAAGSRSEASVPAAALCAASTASLAAMPGSGADTAPSPPVSRRNSSAPTARTWPDSAPSAVTTPSAGEGISTVALSVITAATSWSSRTTSPTFTCHSTTSASATPSPISGSLTLRAAISRLHDGLQRPPDPSGAREVFPFLRVRVGRVPAGNPDDRRFEMVEAGLLDESRELRPEAGGQRRLMRDDAAAGLPDGRFDRFRVERQERAKIDDLRVDPRFGCSRHRDVNDGAVGENCDRLSLAPHRCLAQRHHVVAVRHLALRVFAPGGHRAVVVTVEWAVVDPFRLKE